MRQIIIEVPQGQGEKVLQIAKTYELVNVAQLVGNDENSNPVDIIIAHISNRRLEDFLEDLQPMEDVHISLIPRGVITFRPPATEAPEKVMDVENLSPIEVFMAGLQSIGSWQGFLGYAAVGGVVVWVGLYTNTIYLLVAAMLIAPFAGPAMNTAIATARGDWLLLKRSLIRYFSGLILTIAVTALLTVLWQQKIVTNLMEDVSTISSIAILLPLSAGAAGALQLCQSDRSSLVPGGAVGMLVAASLTPPAGLIGIAGVLGRWEIALSGLFILFLQLVGINLSAALVFRYFGMKFKGARYDRGKSWLFPLTLGIFTVALAGLLTWQFANPPMLQRSTRAKRAEATIEEVIGDFEAVKLVDSEIYFARADIADQNTLMCLLYVQREEGVELSDEQLRDRVSAQIESKLAQEEFNLTPLINITVLQPPAPILSGAN